MRQIDLPTQSLGGSFEYFCPICGIELARSNYESLAKDYFCPYCSTQQGPSRFPARAG